MNAEIVELTEELQSLEAELDKVRREYKEKEENNILNNKVVRRKD